MLLCAQVAIHVVDGTRGRLSASITALALSAKALAAEAVAN